jgi:Sec-independent protein translocase protein TatA
MVFKHYCYRSVIVSLGILLFYGCQPNRLQVKEEEAVGSSLSHTIGKSRDTMTPMQQSIQHSQKISPSDQSNEKPDTTAQQEAATESVLTKVHPSSLRPKKHIQVLYYHILLPRRPHLLHQILFLCWN